MSRLKNSLNDYELWRCTANNCDTAIWLRKTETRLIALVELPGHGGSDIPEWADFQNLRKWSQEIVKKIEEDFPNENRLILFHGITGNFYGLTFLAEELVSQKSTVGKLLDEMQNDKSPQTAILAHSFGCYTVSPENAANAIFLNPVPRVSPTYKFLQKVAKAESLRIVYRSRWFMTLGDWWLLGRTPQRNKKAIFLAKYDSSASRKQQIYQEKLRGLSGEKDVFAEVSPRLVVFGTRDRLMLDRSQNELSEVFPESEIASVKAGHLAPIETPDEIARLIKF